MYDFALELKRRSAIGLGRDKWIHDRHPNWRGWFVHFPEGDEGFRVIWRGCLHICESLLGGNMNSETAPEGLLLPSIEETRNAHYVDEGTELVILEASDPLFGIKYLHLEDWKRLPEPWRIDLLRRSPELPAKTKPIVGNPMRFYREPRAHQMSA